MEEKFIRKLVASMKCETCGHQYEVYDVRVLGHREDLWFLRAFCPACRAQCLVAAVIKEERGCRVVTDLAEAEKGKFRGAVTVGADDVLNMHDFLKDFDGDFARLFGRK